MAPPASSQHKTGELPIRRDRDRDARPAQTKRGRHDVVPAPPSALRVRMDKELVALQGLVKRGKLLTRSAPPAAAPAAENKRAPTTPPRRSSPSAAKRRASPLKPATEAKYAPAKQQQQCPVEANYAAAKQQQQERAAEREEFRQMLLEMEKAALPDETVYPEELQELGIVFEHAVIRTRHGWKIGGWRLP